MAEPWFRCHARLRDKKVVARVARALKIDVATAAGHLVFFWGALAEEVAKGRLLDGDLTHVSDEQIETMANWHGAEGQFANTVRLVHTDNDGRVNEFDEYMGALAERRRKHREKVANWRQSLKAPDDVVDAEIDARIASSNRGRISITPGPKTECAYCAQPAGQWSYVIPLSAGGKRQRSNMVPACSSCVKQRGERSIEDFITSRGGNAETWARALDIDLDALREEFSTQNQFPEQKITIANVTVTNENVSSTNANVIGHNHTTYKLIETEDQKTRSKALNSTPVAPPDSDASQAESATAAENHIANLPPRVKRKLGRWIEKFYPGRVEDDESVGYVLKQVNEALSRQGAKVRGQTVYAEAKTLERAMDAMLDESYQLRKPEAAGLVLLIKLYSGPANLDVNERGETVTETVSRETSELASHPITDTKAAEIIARVASAHAMPNGKQNGSPLIRAKRIDPDVLRRLQAADRQMRSELGMPALNVDVAAQDDAQDADSQGATDRGEENS